MRLQYRRPGEKAQSFMLPFDFKKEATPQALKRIGEIFKRFIQAKEKKTLAQVATITEVSSSRHQINWNGLIDEFRKFVPNASEKTWSKSYLPVLNRAGLFIQKSKGKPHNGEELIMKSLNKDGWEQGKRSRQIARRSLTAFLNWAVLRGKLIAAYAPPAHIPETRKAKATSYHERIW